MPEPVIGVDPTRPRVERYEYLNRTAQAVLAACPDLLSAMAIAANLLADRFPEFSWAGFYRAARPGLLVLGPYRGPLPCVEIPFTRGVCGAAARERKTLVVPDVDAFPGHIACDAASRSEIVVPLLSAAGALLGVLDIDSARPDDFGEADRLGLEKLASLVAEK